MSDSLDSRLRHVTASHDLETPREERRGDDPNQVLGMSGRHVARRRRQRGMQEGRQVLVAFRRLTN